MKVLRIAHHAVVSAWRERERELRASGANVELVSALRWNEGGRVVPLDIEGETWVHGVRTFGTHPNGFLYAPRFLWRALASDPDILDFHEEPFAIATAEVLALRALRRSRVPYVLYSAQNIEKRYPVPIRWLESYALRHASGAYVCNKEAGEILVRKGLRGPAVLIPLGVDVAQFHPAERDAPGGEPVIGYLGRLEPYKGVDVLLRAAAAHPAWRVRLTGDGPESDALHRLAADLGIADRVEFAGFASGDALAARYRELDVVVMPSIPWPGWLEQFGRVAVEAMASGVPVVVSRSGALPDVVEDAGILVEPGDADDLGRGIRDALEPARWADLRARGLARAREFTWERVAAQQNDLYRSIVPAADAGAARSPQIVVVSYGAPTLLADALEVLRGDFSVTIVDNSSLAETRALAETHGAHYLDPGANLGFGAGVNVALRSLAERGLGNDDVLLLNPDARISPDAVAELHRVLHASPRVAAVGATQTDPATGDAVRVWWPFPNPIRAWIEAVGLGRLNRAHGFAIGSILMLRSEAIAEVGPFDERFFLYSEETDWQRRARDAGWSIGVAHVDAFHIGAGTSSDESLREGFFHASAELYQRKHFGAAGWTAYRAAMIAGAAVRSLALRGKARADAAARVRLYLRGPLQADPRTRRS